MPDPADEPDSWSQALSHLLQWLHEGGYQFITVTPATHARVLARLTRATAQDARDAFGWNLPFTAELLPPQLFEHLHAAELVVSQPGELWRSTVRVASLNGVLYAHSAFPTQQADAVFFGPDSYRFARLIESQLQREALPPGARVLDVGCGAGSGGIVAVQMLTDAAATPSAQLVLADINPRALAHASVNAAAAGLTRAQLTLAQGDLYGCVDGSFDLIVSNPPYLNDAAERTYRHGGGAWGGGLSERIVREGLERLAPGGRLLLYSGAAITGGRDPLREALAQILAPCGWPWRYDEIDPDVFGEELEQPAYAAAERIAAVGLVVRRPAR